MSSRNKIRDKLRKLRSEEQRLKGLNYYHRPEDMKEVQLKIQKLETLLR